MARRRAREQRAEFLGKEQAIAAGKAVRRSTVTDRARRTFHGIRSYGQPRAGPEPAVYPESFKVVHVTDQQLSPERYRPRTNNWHLASFATGARRTVAARNSFKDYITCPRSRFRHTDGESPAVDERLSTRLRNKNMYRTALTTIALGLALIGLIPRPASAQPMAKAQVANLITRVENGVDEFRKYLDKRGDSAKETASTAQAQGKTSRRKATESQKAKAGTKKDALDDALGDLNRSTNRLRRKFDPTDKWMETKGEVERVVDDARKVNQVVARGSYGSEAARLWAALRTGINDLARAYGVSPLGV